VNKIIDFGEEGHYRALKEVWATQFWRLDEEGNLHLLLKILVSSNRFPSVTLFARTREGSKLKSN